MKRVSVLVVFAVAIASAVAYTGTNFHGPNGSKSKGSVTVNAGGPPPDGSTNLAGGPPPDGSTNLAGGPPPDGSTNLA